MVITKRSALRVTHLFAEPIVTVIEPQCLKTPEAPQQYTLELTKLRVLTPNPTKSRKHPTMKAVVLVHT